MIKQRYFKFLFILLFVFSFLIILKCKENKKTNCILIGQNECLRTGVKDKVIDPIGVDYVNKFYKYIYIKNTDLVLNKIIESEFPVFISLSFAMNLKDFAQKQTTDSLLKINFYKQDLKSKRPNYTFFIKKKDLFIFRTVFNELNADNIIIYDILSPDSLKLLSKYNQKDYVINKLY
ncbi:MAG: hypothetical protein KA792_05100 [Bacteroidales bacterium]|nr:hypothetical protein [Bacteroidales bacterium]